MSYTYRQLFTKHLPEPYRNQAIANAIADDRNVDDPSETAGVDPEDLHDVVACAFPWKYSPEGHEYWLRASGGEFEVPELQIETGKRYLTRDGRTAEVANEDPAYAPESCYRFDGAVDGETGFCWSATGRYESQRENPLDLVEEIVEEVLVDPGTGYRLLEEGETILEGDEETDDEGGGGWSAVSPRSAGDTFNRDDWYPVRRKIAAPTYRLLNQGEIIREGDEVYLRLGWEAMGDDCAVGANHDPQFQRPIRREIKSHEDA